jgi:hypothetical protein
MKMSEAINEIATALAAAQAEIQNPSKSAENPFFKSRYADLAQVLSVVRPAFTKQHLSIVQMPYTSENGQIGVTTLISHGSGQWMQGEVALPLQVNKNVAQDAGSAITYLRRYALAAACGVAQEDTDGNLGKSKGENTGEVVNLKTITNKQSDEIEALIEATDTNMADFLNWVKTDSIKKIPASKYEKIYKTLLERKEQSA